MKHLLQIADLIEATGLVRKGVNLYLFALPADAQNAVMIRGPLTGDAVDDEQRGFYSSEVMVTIRHADEMTAYDWATKIGDALDFERRQVGEIFFTVIRPRTKPIPYPRNAGGTMEWALPLVVTWGESA